MASTINADTTNGVIVTSDTSGIIEFQSSGTTKAGVNATGLTGNGSQLTALPDPDALSTASGSAPSYSARAWVNFNGEGVVAIRDSGNVSSITDIATGRYTVNFAVAMPDTNYAFSGSAGNLGTTTTARAVNPDGDYSTTLFDIRTCFGSTAGNNALINVIIFR